MTKTTLITIPFSHYCEKSRWMLDLAKVDYVEDGHLPILHRRATRRHRGSSVPVLVTPTQALVDSSDIALWANEHVRILPEDPAHRQAVLALEDDFDTVLGPHLRRVMYFHLLQSPTALAAMLKQVPRGQARIARLAMPAFKRFMRWSLKLTPDGTERSVTRVRATFDAVSARLADGRPYLVGDALSVADITFAALASPVLMPPEHPLPWPGDDALPEPVLALRAALRASDAGRFAARLYTEHRRR